MQAIKYNNKGKESGKIELPAKVFGVEWNADLVHQAVTVAMSNKRTNVAHAKDRSEVSGGGKKPWKQKGTGRARHGSIRSPIWVGGGVAHGPSNETIFARKINKKMKSKALCAVLSAKNKVGEIIFLDQYSLSKHNTKSAIDLLAKLADTLSAKELAYSKGSRALLLTTGRSKEIEKSFANIKIAKVDEVRNVDASLAISYKYIILTDADEGVKILEARA